MSVDSNGVSGAIRSSKARIFTRNEVSVDAILASACLPQIYPAVAIDGEYYWDSGYMGNPVLEPLIDECPDHANTLVVQINPIHRDDVPRTAPDIANRVNEVSFNASLMRELRAIADVTRMIESGVVKNPRYKCVYFHRIAAGDVMKGLGGRSKLDTNPRFLNRLHELGRARAGRWLDEHFDDLGTRSTLDLSAWRPRIV